MMACTFVHDKVAGRAPAGTRLLRTFYSGEQNPELMSATDEQVVSVARQELKQILGMNAQPKFSRIHRWPHSTPQYAVGHPELVARINELESRLGNVSLI